MNKKVLILTAHYIPSVKAGGPIRSIENLIRNLYENIDFYIITSDRDLNDKDSFDDIKFDTWCKVGNAKVYYTNIRKLSFNKMKNIIKEVDYDILYLNSFFSLKWSIYPLILKKMGLIPDKTIVVAPRGEFSVGALNQKYKKKNIYLKLANKIKLYNSVTWHATNEMEKKDIENNIENINEIRIANNLTSNYRKLRYNKSLNKVKGELKLIYVSRITPKKNLKEAIEYLKHIKGIVEYNIYGPIEDEDYWLECKNIINELPRNVSVNYLGIVPHDQVAFVFEKNHVFLFPTLGENYGHVIAEAFIGGCPVIISDQTPWNNIRDENVGWNIPLRNKAEYIKAIQYYIDLDNKVYNKLSKKAFRYGQESSNKLEDLISSEKLFL